MTEERIRWIATRLGTITVDYWVRKTDIASMAEEQSKLIAELVAALRPEAVAHDAILEAAAVCVETMVPVGQPPYLPGSGDDWKAYRQPWEAAKAIRAMKRHPPQSNRNEP